MKVRPNFCTPVFPSEYDYVGQFEDAIKAANKFHKKINEECPAPYYPVDMGKLYGLVVTVEKQDAELAALRSLLSDAMKALEPFSSEDLHKILGGNVWGGESIVFGRGDTELKIKDFRTAAEVVARIKATLTGGE